jgi:hypothetical protein
MQEGNNDVKCVCKKSHEPKFVAECAQLLQDDVNSKPATKFEDDIFAPLAAM